MITRDPKYRRATLSFPAVSCGRSPAFSPLADPALLSRIRDMPRRRKRHGSGPKRRPPRLVLRNGVIYLTHGGRRLSTGFVVRPDEDFRQHAGGRAILRSYTEAQVRALLGLK